MFDCVPFPVSTDTNIYNTEQPITILLEKVFSSSLWPSIFMTVKLIFSGINQFLFQSHTLRQMDVELSVTGMIIMFVAGAYGFYNGLF